MYFTSPITLRGTDTLVNAFSLIRKKIPCKLIFLFRMDYKELSDEVNILKELAKKEGVLDSMEIISKYLSPEEIKEYLSVADVVCLPFKIVISDVPVSILEAMAVGTPVISTKVACITEILKGNGMIVKSNDPLDLATHIINLLNNFKLRNSLVKKSKDFMKNSYDWIEVGKKNEEIILKNKLEKEL